MSDACPLCGGQRGTAYATAHGGDFLRCPGCALIFRAPAQWPAREQEQAHYRLHENDPQDPDYRRFLRPLFDALRPLLAPGAAGLDFGCGPGSALAAMFEEAGYPVRLYDPLFEPDGAVLRARYDFITASEVVEHLHDPASVFAQLDRLLHPGGWLGIMTGTPPATAAEFARWHYLRDPTHVAFYSADTLQWIAARHGWQLQLPAPNVALFCGIAYNTA